MTALLSMSGMSYFLPWPQCINSTVCIHCPGGLTYIIWGVYNLQAHKIITLCDDGWRDLGSASAIVAAECEAAGVMSLKPGTCSGWR